MNFLYPVQNFINKDFDSYMAEYYRWCGISHGGKQSHNYIELPNHVQTKINIDEYFFDFDDRKLIFDTIIGGNEDIEVIYLDVHDDDIDL